jgi:NAD(P)-dependent dehydrogenase (short-subunit alcohol dehydrogenase family)
MSPTEPSVSPKSVEVPSLRGKWAFITGASRGVGKQIALALAERGVNLVLHSRSSEHTVSVLERARALGVEAHGLAAELSDYASLDPLVDMALECSGGLDILYNNAGVQLSWRDTFDTHLDDYEKTFAINVIAPVRLCDRLLPQMIERGFGRVVNVTSGIINIPQLMCYSMSKAALDRYVRDMAPTLENTKVVMSLLDPGWLRTDLGSDAAPNAVESVLPGALVPLLLPDDAPSGRLFEAQDLKDWVEPR